MKIKALSQAGFTVKNLDATIKWYWEVFKLPLIAKMELDKEAVAKLNKLYKLNDTSVKFAMLLCPKGATLEIFEFSKKSTVEHSWNSPSITHFALDVKNVKKWHQMLSARDDVEVLCEPQVTDGNEWFFFRDPDGILVELIDIKMNYFLLRHMNKFAGWLMRKTQFKEYYKK